MQTKTIEYLGKTLKTEFYYPLSDLECLKLKEDFMKKPDFKSVESELKLIFKCGVKTSNITQYYLKPIMSKVKFHHSKWSLEEVFNCNDLIRVLYGKTTLNKKVFPDKDSDIKKIETHIRLAGKGVACKPTKFPIKTVREILELYNINDNYYDFSCGWGDRLLGAMSMNINYFGTDPNYLLTEQLENIKNDYRTTNINPFNEFSTVDIRTQGSEIFISEWENTIGVAFSSPPYFNLENYGVGEQSCNETTKYKDWIDYYYRPTIENIDKYLIENGKIVININDFAKYNLVQDTINLLDEFGYKLIQKHGLKNIVRVYGSINGEGGKNDNAEDIMVFSKHFE